MTIDVSGDIIVGDDGFSDAFAAEVRGILDRGARRIVVCLDARHMTSTAFGAVITAWQEARGRGGRLAAYSPRASLRAVFKLLQHLGIFFDTQDQAVGNVGA